MRLRSAFPFLLLIIFPRTSFSADAIGLKISHFGLEGNYASPAEPTWVEVIANNNTDRRAVFRLAIWELNLENNALPVSEVVTMPAELATSETRVFDVPLHVVAQNYAVLYVQALSLEGHLLGRAGKPVGPKMNGQIIAMLCATPDLCRSIRQAILLSGSPEEQTRKSSSLRLIQLTKPAPTGWAYSPADILIVAAPMAQFSEAQRDALEAYLHRGGTFALMNDQLGDSSLHGQSRFLDAYRSRAEEGRALSDSDLVGKIRDGFAVSLVAAFERFAHAGAVVRLRRRRAAATCARAGFNGSRTGGDLQRWAVVLLDVSAQHPFHGSLLWNRAGAFGGHGGSFRHPREPLDEPQSFAPRGGAACLCPGSAFPQPALSAPVHDG